MLVESEGPNLMNQRMNDGFRVGTEPQTSKVATLFYPGLFKERLCGFTVNLPLVVQWNEKFDLSENLDDIHDVELGIDNEAPSFHKNTSIIARQWGEPPLQFNRKRPAFLLQSGGQLSVAP